MSISVTIGFFGFGNMGQAIARGLVAAGTVPAAQIAAFDQDAEKRVVARDAGMQTPENAEALADLSDILVLATKPQDLGAALDQIAGDETEDSLYISIAAGVGIPFIQNRLGNAARIVRVMPNTPALVGAGAAALAFSESCTEDDRAHAVAIFDAIGLAETVPESSMDAVTALSGSGPAYFFHFVECLVDAAVELGLPKDQATRLAVQTAFGAGKMLTESGEPASVLRERVTSKGGTTAAALAVFAEKDLPAVVTAALEAARNRSQELGR